MKARQISGIPRMTLAAVAAFSLTSCAVPPQERAASFEGKPVSLGKGTARTVVRTDGGGKPKSIAIVLTEAALDGLPTAAPGTHPNFPYVLPMPDKGPRTVVDHVMINWEAAGHSPQKVYGVPHFDFHFYLVSASEREKVDFKDESESAAPSQQPPPELLPAGYVIPPGTAVSGMGVHAINPAAAEFKGQPFAVTFIYGFHDKRQTFLEPMVTLDYLKTKPSFSAPVARPATYLKAGVYPASYSVKYDAAARTYEISLDELR
jgi:hypothetical protein